MVGCESRDNYANGSQKACHVIITGCARRFNAYFAVFWSRVVVLPASTLLSPVVHSSALFFQSLLFTTPFMRLTTRSNYVCAAPRNAPNWRKEGKKKKKKIASKKSVCLTTSPVKVTLPTPSKYTYETLRHLYRTMKLEIKVSI